jgi:hypothetical protein
LIYVKKFALIILALSLVLSSTFALTISAAEESFVVKENIAVMEGVTYSWSGTWKNNGVDSTAGDPGSKCFDGNVNTKWGSADVANGDQWVSVIFPEAVTIDGFKVWQDNGIYTDIKGFKIQVQNGSATWEDVYESPAFADKWREHEHEFSKPVTATAFRIYIPADKSGGKAAVELTEIHVYKIHTYTFGKGNGNTQLEFDSETMTQLSLAGAVTNASSSNNPSSNAIDGSNNTKWSSVGNSTPQWIQIILPEVQNLSGFRFVTDYNWTDIRAYKVEVATKDGWKTAYEYSGESMKHFQQIEFDTLWNTDSIRFTVTEVGSEALAGHGTTSIDVLEILLFTAEAVEQEPETNPQTSDLSVFFMVAFSVVVLSCYLLRKRGFGYSF